MMMIYRSRLWTISTKSGNLLTLVYKGFCDGYLTRSILRVTVNTHGALSFDFSMV